MASIETQVVKMLADQITNAIKTYVGENNRTYVDYQIANSPLSSSSNENITVSGSINASQVLGLSNSIGTYLANIRQSASNGDVNANSIIATIKGIADLQIQNATIDVAKINNLYSNYGEFLNLVASNIEVEDADIKQARIDLANIAKANVGNADIGYAQIKDLTTGTAIITEGIGGKLFIDKLSVVDSNIVSLSAGELMIKNKDGNLVRLVVDDDGNISSEVISLSGDNVISSSSLSGDKVIDNTINATKIIENSITARELNVSSIFADNAMINSIKSSNIDVADLFANNAYISALQTNVISNKAIGDGLDLSENATITMLQGLISLVVEGESTSSEIRLNENFIRAISDNIDLSANNTVRISSENQIDIDAVNNLDLSANNTVRINSAYQISLEAINNLDLSSNHTITFSAEQLEAIAKNINIDANNLNISIKDIDDLSSWFEFREDGLIISHRVKNENGEWVNDSNWKTITDNNGFHIMNSNYGENAYVGSFNRDTLNLMNIQLLKKDTNFTPMKVRPSSKGGWIWVKGN